LVTALDKAIGIQRRAVAAHVRRIRERHPEASPSDVIARLEKLYLAAVIGMGAADGAVAAAPGVGTAAAVALSGGEMVGFLEVSTLFILAVAEVHGIRIDDLEKRRTLVFAVLLGDSGASFVEKAAGRTGKHWGKLLTDAIPMPTIIKINKHLGAQFITKYGTKRGLIVLGRLAPFGIGAVIGGAGNAVFGLTVVAGARRAFGPPDERWPDEDQVDPDPGSEPSVVNVAGDARRATGAA
jgi:hypothetical protein